MGASISGDGFYETRMIADYDGYRAASLASPGSLAATTHLPARSGRRSLQSAVLGDKR
jgi:hypothetical protein